MAPPFGLVRSSGSPSARMHGITWAAKASFSSIASHSAGAMPVRSELLDRAARARVLVLAHELCAVVHGLDLTGEEAVRFRSRVAVLAPGGIAVLLRTADVLFGGDVLGGLAERDRVIAKIGHAR